MKIKGLTLKEIQDVAKALDLEIHKPKEIKGKKDNLLWVQFQLKPPNSKHKYARKSPEGRQLKACSYFAFRDFILACFQSYNQVTNNIVNDTPPPVREPIKIISTYGKWTNRENFVTNLRDLGMTNVGSQITPCAYIETSNDDFGEMDPYQFFV